MVVRKAFDSPRCPISLSSQRHQRNEEKCQLPAAQLLEVIYGRSRADISVEAHLITYPSRISPLESLEQERC